MAQWQLFMEVHENLRESQKVNGTQIFRGKKEKRKEKKKRITGNYNPLNLTLIHSKIMKPLWRFCNYLGLKGTTNNKQLGWGTPHGLCCFCMTVNFVAGGTCHPSHPRIGAKPVLWKESWLLHLIQTALDIHAFWQRVFIHYWCSHTKIVSAEALQWQMLYSVSLFMIFHREG